MQVISLVSQERNQERIEGEIIDDLVPQLTEVPIPQTGKIDEMVNVISSERVSEHIVKQIEVMPLRKFSWCLQCWSASSKH